MSVLDIGHRGLRARTARDSFARLAKHDPAFFQQYVIRHDRTGVSLKLSATHNAWHDLMTTRDRLVIWAHVEAAKTTSVSIARVLWELGRDPTLRVLILSNTHAQAAKIVNALAGYIERSDLLHKVFPDLVPSDRKSDAWKPLAGSITVRRPNLSKDASITAAGVHGNVLGARYDLVVVDDVLDYENTRTADQRKQLIEWIQATVQGRLTAMARLWIVGTAFHLEDALHFYARQFGPDRAYRYPVINANNEPRWPEVWPTDRIERTRESMGPLEFSRQMLCLPRTDEEARFKRDWIDKALALGHEYDLSNSLIGVPPGARVITGVDLAVQQHSSADLTVFVTILAWPDQRRQLLSVESGRWTGPEIVERIVDVYKRFQGLIIVENNAAQAYIEQYTRQRGIPVRGFTTGRNKAHPEYGVESLATELARGQWVFPSRSGVTRELDALISGLLNYNAASHTSDHVMALWLAREGIRMGEVKAETGRLDLMSR